MAFPTDLEIEVAFNNDIDETTYAQSGWTSILPFVSSFSGDLRGRAFELDRTEAGSLSVVLDNSDSRFIPGSVQSPYYPFVKADRRFRIRGKNMVHPNVARGGSRDRNMTGFIIPNNSINPAQFTSLTALKTTPLGLLPGTFELSSNIANWTATGCTLTQSSAQAYTGSNSGLMTVTGTPTQAYIRPNGANAVPVTVGVQYQVSLALRSPSSLPSVSPAIDWLTSAGAYISTSVPAGVALTANTWTVLSTIGTAPATAAFAVYGPTIGSSPATGTQIFTDAIDFTAVPTGSATSTQQVYAMDDVRIITASAEPNASIGQGKEKVYDGLLATKWTINTQAGSITYKLPTSVRVTRYTLGVPAGNSNNNPKNWTLQGSANGSTFTTLHTVTNNTWAGDYDSQEFTVTSPGFYLYYKLDITANIGATTSTQLAEFDINYDNAATDLVLVNSDLTHYVESTIPVNQGQLGQYRRLVQWYGPLEYGVRLAHSMYVWKISGTEPAGLRYKLDMTYWDQDWVQINSDVDVSQEITTIPTSSTPTQIGLSHTPPASAKFGVLSFSVLIGGVTNSTDLVYGVTGIQTELPTNLAPDISGFRDQINWQLQGDGDGDYFNVGADPTTSYLSVKWGLNDSNLFITIPHLIPGETYTATVEAQKVGTQPDVLFSGDEGKTGGLINTTSFAQYTITFEAQQAEQELRFILQGTPTNTEGLRVRKLRVEYGTTTTLPTTAIESGYTSWVRPKDIFEGWVESWPAVGGSTEMTITVVDRMKRIGLIELANTLRESLFQDGPKLLMPLSDSMLDTPGRFSQLGSWGDDEDGPAYVDISHSRGDLSTSSYTTLTDDGPTGEASLKFNSLTPGANSIGYFLTIPYSKDYVPPSSSPVVKPQPKPSQPTYKQTYTKKWYATWSRSYEGNDSTRFDDSPNMYQGSYDASSPGNQKSLAGFDYKNVMATLKGAEILEAHFTIRNTHARWNKGLYAQVGTHNYSSKPSTWNTATVYERKWKKWVTEGGTLSIDIGASTGRAFRDGTVKGIAIGPEATDDHNNYGYFAGATQSGRPVLTIKYRR